MRAARQRAFLEAEQEDGVEVARPCAGEVEDGDATPLEGRPDPYLRVLERRKRFVLAQLFSERAPAVQLVEQTTNGVVGAQVGPARGADRRRLEAV